MHRSMMLRCYKLGVRVRYLTSGRAVPDRDGPAVVGQRDWRCGESIPPRQGRREDRLGPPADVGEALDAYLIGPETSPGCPPGFHDRKAPHAPIRADLVRRRGRTSVPARSRSGHTDWVIPWPPPTCSET
jgi:hypothetical protein